jgi:hypothetical protein
MKSTVFLQGWTMAIACCLNHAVRANDLPAIPNSGPTNHQVINPPPADRRPAVDDKSVSPTEQIRELRASILAMKQRFDAEMKHKDAEIAALKREVAEMKVKLAGLPGNASGHLPSLEKQLTPKTAGGTNRPARPAAPSNLRVVGN